MEINYTKLREELVEELSLKGLADEKQDELIGKMLEALLKRIFLDTMEKLGDDGVAEYERLVTANSSEDEIARFLEARIPNYDAFVQEIVKDFKSGLKAAAI